jgi:hypothetical protein
MNKKLKDLKDIVIFKFEIIDIDDKEVTTNIFGKLNDSEHCISASTKMTHKEFTAFSIRLVAHVFIQKKELLTNEKLGLIKSLNVIIWDSPYMKNSKPFLLKTLK